METEKRELKKRGKCWDNSVSLEFEKVTRCQRHVDRSLLHILSLAQVAKTVQIKQLYIPFRFVSQRLFVRPLLNQTPRRYSDYSFIFKIKSMSFSRKKQDTSVFHWVSLKTWRFIRTSVVFQNSSARSVSTHCFSITSAFDLESMCMETSF